MLSFDLKKLADDLTQVLEKVSIEESLDNFISKNLTTIGQSILMPARNKLVELINKDIGPLTREQITEARKIVQDTANQEAGAHRVFFDLLDTALYKISKG